MREAELRSGVPEEDAWKVVYSGCQWFCIPGKEYCDQDVNSTQCARADEARHRREPSMQDIARFRGVLRPLRGRAYASPHRRCAPGKTASMSCWADLWPEMFTSMNSHGPIERGIDMVDNRGVDYQFTSVNILGIPNVADSFHAIKKLVFEKKMYTLAEVQGGHRNATGTGREPMRQRFLNQDKFGNDLDEVDALFVRITESLARILDGLVNLRGQAVPPLALPFPGPRVPRDHRGHTRWTAGARIPGARHQSTGRAGDQRPARHRQLDCQSGPAQIPGRADAGRAAAQLL